MTYELCKKLKDAGFPQKSKDIFFEGFHKKRSKNSVCRPTLSELIDSCGGSFAALLVGPGLLLWTARGNGIEIHDSTPEEAVANLWLVLNAGNKENV